MGKFLSLIGLALVLTACPAPAPLPPGATPTPTPVSVLGCSTETLADTALAGVMLTVDGCTNTAQMTADFQSKWGTLNLCSTAVVAAATKKHALAHKAFIQAHGLKYTPLKAETGIIADIVCPVVVDGLESLLVNGPPSNWNCTGSAPAAAAAQAACMLLPF